MKKEVLITGGAGYIGTTLIPYLLVEGYNVTVYDSLSYEGDILIPYFANPNFKFIKGDILEKDKFMNYELLKLLSIVVKEKLRNMIFIYDLETTGLITNNDFVDIIDRHFEEFDTSVIPSSGLVKLEHNPCIPYEIMELTSISDEQLLNYGDNYYKFSQEIDNIFSYCENPIFIAHNGNSFDHKILNSIKLQFPICLVNQVFLD